MANTKNSALTELNAVPDDDDLLYIVDTSDTTMASSGTSKKNKAKYYLRTNGTANTLGANINANGYNFTGAGTVAAAIVRAANYYGGTVSGGTATISSTSHATKGKILFGSVSAYDEVNNRWGFGTVDPSYRLHVNGGTADGILVEATTFPVIRWKQGGTARFEMYYNQVFDYFTFARPGVAEDIFFKDGKMGIGRTPTSNTFEIAGVFEARYASNQRYAIGLQPLSGQSAIYAYDYTGSVYTPLLIDAATIDLRPSGDGSKALSVDSNGNVSIGGRLGEVWGGLTFGSGWANFGSGFSNGELKKIGDMVFLRGMVYRFTGSGATMGTLPSGYRPPSTGLFNVQTNTGIGRVDIDSSGNITHVAGGTSWVSLFGIVFSTI